MTKRYFKLSRPDGMASVMVLTGSPVEIAQGLNALLKLGEEPIEITAAESRSLKNAQRRAAMREAIARDRPKGKNARRAFSA